ncbi:NADPH-dependent oxidoreductase [Roseomonas sp. 18066]|uniref:NADPH-dependent oxidoreductase n=1 Tax=Roseomonas sp. 18066 TaxID=2681412 RepID=UPI00135CA524|nr:NADPH-dependent oxidoreductase [Roseomonas sp. 18066]
MSLAQRYAAGDAPSAILHNPTIDALLQHRTVRRFDTGRALPENLVETLVAAAQSAATSSNLQSWSVIAVTDPARRARLAGLAAGQGFVAEAPLFLVWVADLSRNRALGAAQGQDLSGLDYLESFMVAAIDAALAAQNATIAAEALGLGTCYIGALRNQPEPVAAELGLPPGAMGLFGMGVGWPVQGPHSAVKPRLPQSVVLHHETYRAEPADAAAVTRYDAAMEEFSTRVGQGSQRWVPRMLSRLADAAALSGRDRMRAALTTLGFGLK